MHALVLRKQMLQRSQNSVNLGIITTSSLTWSFPRALSDWYARMQPLDNRCFNLEEIHVPLLPTLSTSVTPTSLRFHPSNRPSLDASLDLTISPFIKAYIDRMDCDLPARATLYPYTWP